MIVGKMEKVSLYRLNLLIFFFFSFCKVNHHNGFISGPGCFFFCTEFIDIVDKVMVCVLLLHHISTAAVHCEIEESSVIDNSLSVLLNKKNV